MPTGREIITAGYREANFKAQVSALTTEEETEGLTALQGIVDTFYGMVMGVKPIHWYIPRPQVNSPVEANYPARPGDQSILDLYDPNNPPPNSRVFFKGAVTDRIYLQYQPDDGAFVEFVDNGFTNDITIDGNGMLFGGLAGVDREYTWSARFPSNGRNTPIKFIYRADWAAWTEITTVALDEQFPFPTMFDDYFITHLAIRLAPRYGNEPVKATLMRYQQMEVFIRGWYRQTTPALVGDAGTPTEHSWGGRGIVNDPERGF